MQTTDRQEDLTIRVLNATEAELALLDRVRTFIGQGINVPDELTRSLRRVRQERDAAQNLLQK